VDYTYAQWSEENAGHRILEHTRTSAIAKARLAFVKCAQRAYLRQQVDSDAWRVRNEEIIDEVLAFELQVAGVTVFHEGARINLIEELHPAINGSEAANAAFFQHRAETYAERGINLRFTARMRDEDNLEPPPE
jgi:hypothetical protein